MQQKDGEAAVRTSVFYVVPSGVDLEDAVELAEATSAIWDLSGAGTGLLSDAFQLSTCMYYTGLDPDDESGLRAEIAA